MSSPAPKKKSLLRRLSTGKIKPVVDVMNIDTTPSQEQMKAEDAKRDAAATKVQALQRGRSARKNAGFMAKVLALFSTLVALLPKEIPGGLPAIDLEALPDAARFLGATASLPFVAAYAAVCQAIALGQDVLADPKTKAKQLADVDELHPAVRFVASLMLLPVAVAAAVAAWGYSVAQDVYTSPKDNQVTRGCQAAVNAAIGLVHLTAVGTEA